jgi:hypothetical protein
VSSHAVEEGDLRDNLPQVPVNSRMTTSMSAPAVAVHAPAACGKKRE